MKLSKMRVLGAVIVSLALAAAMGVAPASAADTLVTMSGHVTDRDGKPVKGITVQSDCGCDTSNDRNDFANDVTSSTGFYSYRVNESVVLNISFNDKDEDWFGVGRRAGTTKKTSTGYVVNVTMEKVSRVSGTITAINGARTRSTTAKFYDVKTGRGSGSGFADSTGKYEARVKQGSYKVLFGGGYYIEPVWYGQALDKAQSPTVTVGYGATLTGIDATVSPTPTISGTFTIDGKTPLNSVKEALAITLSDANGALQGIKTVSRNGFSFVQLKPGTYTLVARPTAGSGNHVEPLTQTIELAANTAIIGLVVNLTSIPATKTHTRSSEVEFFESSKGLPKPGKILKGKIVVSSYGDVTGGRVVIYVNGHRVDTRTVPASGRINWAFAPKSVVFGKFNVKVKYFGTETTRPRSAIVYGLFGA